MPRSSRESCLAGDEDGKPLRVPIEADLAAEAMLEKDFVDFNGALTVDPSSLFCVFGGNGGNVAGS